MACPVCFCLARFPPSVLALGAPVVQALELERDLVADWVGLERGQLGSELVAIEVRLRLGWDLLLVAGLPQ
jgi:hypothetical protein